MFRKQKSESFVDFHKHCNHREYKRVLTFWHLFVACENAWASWRNALSAYHAGSSDMILRLSLNEVQLYTLSNCLPFPAWVLSPDTSHLLIFIFPAGVEFLLSVIQFSFTQSCQQCCKPSLGKHLTRRSAMLFQCKYAHLCDKWWTFNNTSHKCGRNLLTMFLYSSVHAAQKTTSCLQLPQVAKRCNRHLFY